MPFNGSGQFLRVYSWQTDAANGIDVSSSRMDTDTNDIASGLSNCITKDGQQILIANIPFAGYKITGLGTGSSPTDSVNYAQVFTSPTFTSPSAAVTPTLGNSSTLLATTAFVAATAFSSALPAQSGNSGKYITTNGSVASWGFVTLIRSARTSNTILALADAHTMVDITSGTFSQTFTAAATLTSGWWLMLRNSGTGAITLDPNGSETIDGLTTFIMYPGEARIIQCDGSNFYSFVISPFAYTFTTSGTFTQPPGYTSTGVRAIGAGGGGGSGSRQAASNARPGGSGGGGGALAPSILKLTAGTGYTVTIGAGGTAGAAVSVNGTDGNAGTAGGNTTFSTLLSSFGGGGGDAGATGSGGIAGGGGGGTGSAGTIGNGGQPISVTTGTGNATGGGGGNGINGTSSGNAEFGGGAGGGVITGAGGTGAGGGSSIFAAPGGGGGGGIGNGDVVRAGGAGGLTQAYTQGGGAAGGAATGASGTAGTASTTGGCGTSGGGGGGSAAGAGGTGGAGAAPGGAGGGGAGSVNGQLSGAGGVGARGECQVWGVA